MPNLAQSLPIPMCERRVPACYAQWLPDRLSEYGRPVPVEGRASRILDPEGCRQGTGRLSRQEELPAPDRGGSPRPKPYARRETGGTANRIPPGPVFETSNPGQ